MLGVILLVFTYLCDLYVTSILTQKGLSIVLSASLGPPNKPLSSLNKTLLYCRV